MPIFTCPAGDALVEVNHCHGPGKGHPCGSGQAAGLAPLSRKEALKMVRAERKRAMQLAEEDPRRRMLLHQISQMERAAKDPNSAGYGFWTFSDAMSSEEVALRRAAASTPSVAQRRVESRIRQREDITTPDTPENAAHFSVGIEHTPLPTRPWRVITASGRTLKRFNTADEADKFVKSGKAHHAAQRWAPGKHR